MYSSLYSDVVFMLSVIAYSTYVEADAAPGRVHSCLDLLVEAF